MKNLDDLKEQLQEDAITICQGILEDSELDTLCNIIIERVIEYVSTNTMPIPRGSK